MSLPAWTEDPDSLMLSEEQYDALPDQYRKMIEVIDGYVVVCQSGSPEHSRVARRLANLLEAAKPAEPCAQVDTDIDVYFAKRRKPGGRLSFRRPDVAVYRCVGRGSKVTTREALMVVEVVSPGS